MRQNDINDFDVKKLASQNLENIFNVYQNEDETYYYNLLKTANFPDDIDPFLYSEYETNPGDTWPLIAWQFYKDVRLWWVICAVNNIQNPVAQPEASTLIKILDSSVVRDVLTKIKGD